MTKIFSRTTAHAHSDRGVLIFVIMVHWLEEAQYLQYKYVHILNYKRTRQFLICYRFAINVVKIQNLAICHDKQLNKSKANEILKKQSPTFDVILVFMLFCKIYVVREA